jgi:hypothetical protein
LKIRDEGGRTAGHQAVRGQWDQFRRAPFRQQLARHVVRREVDGENRIARRVDAVIDKEGERKRHE